MHLALAKGLAVIFQGFAGFQTPFLQSVPQAGDRPVAGGVLGVCPLDVRGAVFVHDHRFDVGAVDAAGDIQIADRCLSRGAAPAHFLLQAFLGFGG
ncbi:hypothetical protein D2E98_25580 [Mycobacteroides abscessus]|nr:hypothetical protein DDJ47_16305 [Mycobacteroides abscessus]RIT33781.1 hypothetical protein D2E98_25580 [Mycobacteroides abscessus]